jgi:hypothetical protein
METQIGKKYLFMTQRYAFIGTVLRVTPTHVTLGDDARILYENIGMIHLWASGERTTAESGKEGPVPGQIVSALGTDITPIP